MSAIPPEKGDICAVVVTYFPDASFKNYLAEIRTQVDTTIIVDNGSGGAPLAMLRSLADETVSLFELGRNTGLGSALNYGIEKAKSREYAWVILFDQDTLPINDMTLCFSDYPKPRDVALIGSKFLDRNKLPHLPPRDKAHDPTLWMEKKRVITSGTLVSIDAFEAIGPFREDFFIDSIDHEYCHRAHRKGWKILKSSQPLISHSVGNYKKHRLLWLDIWRSHHSAMRCYFMARNQILIAWEYRQYAKLFRGGLKVLKNMFYILLFEEDKLNKIKASLAGYADGIMNKAAMPGWIQRDIK